MDKLNKTSFIFLRHGEPLGGVKFRGSTDDPLTELGWSTMRTAVDNMQFDEIISSPLKRCSDFSEKLCSKLNIPLYIYNDLQELHLGEWEGLSPSEVEKLDAEALYAFWDDPIKNTPPSAENFIDFECRVLKTWDKLNKKYVSTENSKTILVVMHAGVMMVLLKKLLDIPIENILTIKLNFASKVRVEMHASSYQLKPQIYIEHGYDF